MTTPQTPSMKLPAKEYGSEVNNITIEYFKKRQPIYTQDELDSQLSIAHKQGEQRGLRLRSPNSQMYQLGLQDGLKEEKKKLLEAITEWKKSHFPNEDASWYIQNLLGEYLGWGSDEQKEMSKIFEGKI